MGTREDLGSSLEDRCRTDQPHPSPFPGGRTEEGFLIFSEEELKLNGGGGTPLCPFDCDCCELKFYTS